MTEATHQMTSNPLPPGARVPGSVGVPTGVEIGIMDEGGTLLPTGSGRGGDPRPERDARLPRTTPRPTPPRSSTAGSAPATGASSTRRLPAPRGADQGADQPRRREDLAPRDRRGLLGHPAVAEAVCFGVPTRVRRGGRRRRSLLDGEATAELISYCRERLAEFKVPETIHVRRTIPRTATGKVQRRRVGELVAGGEAANEVRHRRRRRDRRDTSGRALARGGEDVDADRPRPAPGGDAGRGVRVRSPRGDFAAQPDCDRRLRRAGPTRT